MSRRDCRHPSCTCAASDDSDFCSAVCAESAGGGITADGCECGHGDCGRAYDRAAVGARSPDSPEKPDREEP